MLHECDIDGERQHFYCQYLFNTYLIYILYILYQNNIDFYADVYFSLSYDLLR